MVFIADTLVMKIYSLRRTTRCHDRYQFIYDEKEIENPSLGMCKTLRFSVMCSYALRCFGALRHGTGRN